MSDISTDSQVDFEIILDDIELMATPDDVVSDSEWVDADGDPPTSSSAPSADHDYTAPTPTVTASAPSAPPRTATAATTNDASAGGNDNATSASPSVQPGTATNGSARSTASATTARNKAATSNSADAPTLWPTNNKHSAGSRHETGGVAPGDTDLMPTRYSGDRTTDAAEWLQDFLDYLSIRSISEATAVVLMRTRLTGAARRWYDGLPTGMAFADIIGKFRQRFGAVQGLRPELLRSFWSARQGPNEASAEYIERMTHLARRMGLSNDALVCQVTLQGLRYEIQRDVALRNPTNMDELAAAAEIGENNALLAAAHARGPAGTDNGQLTEMCQMMAAMQSAITERPAPPTALAAQKPIDNTAAQLAELRQMMVAMQSAIAGRQTPASGAACNDRSTAAVPPLPTNAVAGIAGAAPTTDGIRGGNDQGRRGRGRPWRSGPPPPRPTTTNNDATTGTERTNDTVCHSCGWQHAPGNCRAASVTCHECSAVGHYARCCPRRAVATPRQ